MLDVLSERVVEENEPEWAGLGQDDILEAMEQLTPVYRAVFNLYAIEGYGHRDIAIELGISEGTSKSNYAKARRNLRELLRKKLREK
jgi:RNA polymerase sigma-70 factor (ECF subfamily)